MVIDCKLRVGFRRAGPVFPEMVSREIRRTTAVDSIHLGQPNSEGVIVTED